MDLTAWYKPGKPELMNNPGHSSRTLEQALFERMGVSIEDAIATGTDFVDEKASRAAGSGIEVDQRLQSLGRLFEKVTEPSTLSALNKFVDQLPHLARLAELVQQLPGVVGTIGDIVDDYQLRCESRGIDFEKALTNGLNALLYVGSQVEDEHLRRIGDLLGSDIFNPHALNVVDNAAKSLNTAQQEVCGSSADRVGLFGLLGALRDPQIQRSLAFAIQFGKCFGNNIDQSKS